MSKTFGAELNWIALEKQDSKQYRSENVRKSELNVRAIFYTMLSEAFLRLLYTPLAGMAAQTTSIGLAGQVGVNVSADESSPMFARKQGRNRISRVS